MHAANLYFYSSMSLNVSESMSEICDHLQTSSSEDYKEKAVDFTVRHPPASVSERSIRHVEHVADRKK